MTHTSFAIVIDDDEDCREDVINAFPNGRLTKCLEYSSSTEFQNRFLKKLRSKNTDEMPGVVFLDIRMEQENSGIELLKSIRRRKKLKKTPVIMISSSDDEIDVDSSFRYGANLYIVKSEEPRHFAKTIQCIVKILSTDGMLPAYVSSILSPEEQIIN